MCPPKLTKGGNLYFQGSRVTFINNANYNTSMIFNFKFPIILCYEGRFEQLGWPRAIRAATVREWYLVVRQPRRVPRKGPLEVGSCLRQPQGGMTAGWVGPQLRPLADARGSDGLFDLFWFQVVICPRRLSRRRPVSRAPGIHYLGKGANQELQASAARLTIEATGSKARRAECWG